MTASSNSKRVFYVKFVNHPIFLERLGARPDIRIDKVENQDPAATADPILSEAHAYQITSARDELNPQFYATAELLKRTPRLLVVSTGGAGYDTVDLKACTEAGVLVVNQAGGNAEAVAEHVLGMMLCLSKRIIQVDRAMRREDKLDRNLYMGNDIIGRTVGIVGLGHVGSRIAALCRSLFKMRVLSYDPYLTAEEMQERGAEKVELDELLRRSDFVSINCPLTDETRGMIGAAQYALMQKHAYFITAARGFIHDERALYDALKDKRIAGAGLDVWSKEPPPRDHPLMEFDNVLVSPHTAGVTVEARTNMGTIAADQLIGILDGKRPPRILNPAVWPAYAQRFEKTFGFRPDGS